MKKIFLFLLLATQAAQAQVSIRAAASKTRIVLGEQFTLSLETRMPANAPVPRISIDTIPHFEILNEGLPVESVEGSTKVIRQDYTLTSFDSGHWVIPSFRIAGRFFTDTIGVDVVFSNFDPEQPYHDIADIIEVEPAFKERWWWYIGAAAFFLLLILTWLLTRKKKRPETVEEKVDPYAEAMKSLESARSRTHPSKEYYTELVNIFRIYVFRKRGITSLQKTTDDLILQLHALPFSETQFSNLSQALRLSDFVKFAKYRPTAEDDKFSFEEIKKSITEIEKMN